MYWDVVLVAEVRSHPSGVTACFGRGGLGVSHLFKQQAGDGGQLEECKSNELGGASGSWNVEVTKPSLIWFTGSAYDIGSCYCRFPTMETVEPTGRAAQIIASDSR